jgi:nonspecific dipeptidase
VWILIDPASLAGVHGGAVNEPMIDVVHLMSKLVAPNGKILVPGLQEMVRPMEAEEKATYDAADFDLEEYKEDTGIVGGKLLHETKQEILIHRWREPCLSLHGVQGDWSGAGAKTVIPRKVGGGVLLGVIAYIVATRSLAATTITTITKPCLCRCNHY